MIVFKHQKYKFPDKKLRKVTPQATFAIEPPTKETLLALLNTPFDPSLKILLGAAFCHPDDEFRKKFGRNYAQTKLKQHTAQLISVTVGENRLFFTFFLEVETSLQSVPKRGLDVVFSVYRHSDTVKVEDIYTS